MESKDTVRDTSKDRTFTVNFGEVVSNPAPNRWGVVKVVKVKEFCLTCGSQQRVQWIESNGNEKITKQTCLFCVVENTKDQYGHRVKHSTARNRESCKEGF